MHIEIHDILLDPEVENQADLFRLFYNSLHKKGIVKKGFYKALVNREKSSPTGLDTGVYRIAIPHTDPDMINCEGMAVAVLKKPVLFGEMGTYNNRIEASMVFLILIKGGKTRFYHNLLNKIKNSDILHEIYNSDNRQHICLLLTELLNT